MTAHRVMMHIEGREVPSSCAHMGTEKQCAASAARLNRQKDKHRDIEWRVLPAIAPPAYCNMGVGCEESGVCYAEAHGEPDRCGRVA